MSEVVATEGLNESFTNIYKKRKKDNEHSDIWNLSLNWEKEREVISDQLLKGEYQLSPVKVFKGEDKKYYTRFNSKDAIVIKAITNIISNEVQQSLSNKCTHLKGNGGLKGAINNVISSITRHNGKDEAKSKHKYIVKSDIANFYQTMNHQILLDKCAEIIKDKRILSLLYQYMNRVEIYQGENNLISEEV